MRTLTVVAVAPVALSPCTALAQSVEGAWRLAEYSSPDGPTYTEPASLMIFADGYYSRVYVRANDTRQPVTETSTNAERVATWDPFVSNSGTYTFNGSALTRRIVVAKQPSVIGTPTTLEARIDGNTLVLTGNSEGDTATTQRWVRAWGGM